MPPGRRSCALRTAARCPQPILSTSAALQFLMKTQAADGSWFVQSRAVPLQPHFEADFPYGKDQFISAAATNWATMALALAAKSGS